MRGIELELFNAKRRITRQQADRYHKYLGKLKYGQRDPYYRTVNGVRIKIEVFDLTEFLTNMYVLDKDGYLSLIGVTLYTATKNLHWLSVSTNKTFDKHHNTNVNAPFVKCRNPTRMLDRVMAASTNDLYGLLKQEQFNKRLARSLHAKPFAPAVKPAKKLKI